MTKSLIYQVYVGKQSALYDYCTKSVERYAKRIGADYICQTQPILRIKPNPFTSNRSKEAVDRLGYLPIYEKENAFDHFKNGYKRIAIIDSDVFIRDNAPNIFNELENGQEFGAVIESSMPLTPQYRAKITNYSRMQYDGIARKILWPIGPLGYEFMNMGVMVLDETVTEYFDGQTAKQFLERPIFQPFIDGVGAWKWSTDQTLLNAWIRSERMNIKNLHWKWNGLFSANTKIKQCHFVHFFLKDKLPNRGENVEELMKQI